MPLDKSKLSRFLSFVLRHNPGSIDLQLNEEGWVRIDELMRKAKAVGKGFRRDDLLEVIATNDKQRFTLSPDGQRIRAAQGHSIAVKLGLEPLEPPPRLYHGTASRSLDAIWSDGIRPQRRQQVHLSLNRETAERVGQRHGKPVVLVIDADAMHREGFKFYQADNGVWLTDHVPPAYLAFSSGADDELVPPPAP
ncbi:putative RNA 2'-phosphotransferase [Bradyrhizobium sp. USDA 4341]